MKPWVKTQVGPFIIFVANAESVDVDIRTVKVLPETASSQHQEDDKQP